MIRKTKNMKYPLWHKNITCTTQTHKNQSSSSFNDVLTLKVRSSNSEAFQNEGKTKLLPHCNLGRPLAPVWANFFQKNVVFYLTKNLLFLFRKKKIGLVSVKITKHSNMQPLYQVLVTQNLLITTFTGDPLYNY